MTTPGTIEPFRLAIRGEGDYVNAYFTGPDTMEGAMLLGSMRRSVLNNTPGAFATWTVLLQEIVNHACVQALGVAPVDYEVRTAPEHEKSGRA